MKSLAEDIKRFMTNRLFCAIVCLAAAGSYGFLITHGTIGIDDTCVSLYFEDGLAPAVGRFVLFLINKLFHISVFTPWITDLAGVLLLILDSVLWCVLLWRVFGDRVSIVGYTFFAALFLSCPLISEVYVYYLHNGIGLGYGLTAIALFFVQDALKDTAQRKRCILDVLGGAVFLTVALGCYESFMMVYIIGVLLLFLAAGLTWETGKEGGCSRKIWHWAVLAIVPMILSMVFRGGIIGLVRMIFQVSIPENFLVESRETFTLFGGDISELFMYFKRYWVKYWLNFFAYLPITVLVFGTIVLFVFCTFQGIRKKNFWLPLAAAAIPVLPALMIFIEGKESFYRAGQYVPLIGAFAAFLLIWKGQRLPVWGRRAGVLLLAALLWNQCENMNHWFYVDYIKYEYFKSVVTRTAYDLERECDLSKPVIFGGECGVPDSFLEGAYLGFDSGQYRIIKRIGDLVDEHLIEKYNTSNGMGYIFVETPIASTLQWGVTAFDGTSREIAAFMALHGHEVRIETDLQKIEEANELRKEMPGFPQEGYIREFDEYIIVNF